MDEKKQVKIYTDGFCLNNPGRGGYGAILIYGQHQKEILGGYRLTTNNRMELIIAVIKSLESLKMDCDVTLYSDSKYVVDSMTKGWSRQWQANHWRRKKHSIKNVDLWKQLLKLCDRHNVQFEWVKGHAGILDNERADQLSMQGAELDEEELANDTHYENDAANTDTGIFLL